ncbi:TetR/AcrR family transcriptional regulator [Camelliibacillus cellulosilyticus]|uniref:TetR/AcrR family transcriptional regulator n=1 Tax=Camelliibacillus cellulosilyticus TaxID=2174486 RepID=A0ABV9GKR6_9BACL
MNKGENIGGEARKRAPRMSIEKRRAMIVKAALPLLIEIGPTVTTLQIARAAGISEPAIYRAFADKNEVLTACMEEAMNPNHIVTELEAIETEGKIDERLTAIFEALRANSERTMAVMHTVRMAMPQKSNDQRSLSEQEKVKLIERRKTSFLKVHGAVCKILKPDENNLRLTVEDIATLILTIGMTPGRGIGPAMVTSDKLVDLILHGIMK